MKQLVQSIRSGELELIEVPNPVIGPTEVLVRPSHSVVSAGTEKAARRLASANLLAKARARPDLVRQVIKRARSSGVRSTAQVVKTRLDEVMPLGYSAAGTVVQVGEAVSGLWPGQFVATGGAGHGELQVVSGMLTVPVDESVDATDASFATLGAIGLQGLRIAGADMGGHIAVIGLGLIGQLTVRLALAAGLAVTAIDLREWTVAMACSAGALGLVERGEATTASVLDWTKGRGVDAVVITAATPSSEPVLRAAPIARDGASVVIVGDVGLDLDRTPFYDKALSLRFARSYGPGRYDRSYEEWGVDYPIGQVRWTEGRNLETVVSLMASQRLRVDDLVTHRFKFTEAKEAYALLSDTESRYLGIQLAYSDLLPPAAEPISATIQPIHSGLGIGLVGAGNFARGVLVPALKEAGLNRLVAVTSAGGISAKRLAESAGFTRVAGSMDEIVSDEGIDIIVIASSHDTHAELAVRALSEGKHVFCEKPLALTENELLNVDSAWSTHRGHLMVGFNRRHSPAVARAKAALGPGPGPLVITVRVNAGALPPKHWYHDRRQGGRILGELCHFVDTCQALVGHQVTRITAMGSGRSELALDSDVGVTLGYIDGSVATISYASGGHPAQAKERIEVLGRGHSVEIQDFTHIVVDGKSHRLGGQDKGHVEQLRSFAVALHRGGDRAATQDALHSMWCTLAIIEALSTGREVRPGPVGGRTTRPTVNDVPDVPSGTH